MPTVRHLLTTTLLFTPLVAQKVNEIEPNDTPAQAQAIAPGMHVACTYTTAAPTDDDWFSFTLAAPGQVHLHASAGGTLSLGISRDNRIAIYDASGTARLAWNDSAVGSMADCGVTLPPGSYTAVVNLKTGGVAGNDYGLDFYVLPVNPIDAFEGAEPNDSTGTPTPFALGDTLEGDLSTSADVDFWQFTLTGRGYVAAATYDDGGVPQLDNLALRFYQETTPGVWTAIGASNATNSASHRVTTLAHPGLLGAGTYAIAVQAGTAAAGTAPWNYVKTGRYSLRTCLIDMPGTSGTPEAPELVAIRWQKTDGSTILRLIEGSIVLSPAGDGDVTEIELVYRVDALASGVEDYSRYVNDVFADARAVLHGEALPTFE